MYTLEEIKKLRVFDEEDYDENRKMFADEIIKSRKEKLFFGFLVAISTTLWVFYFRYQMQAYLNGTLSIDWFWNLLF